MNIVEENRTMYVTKKEFCDLCGISQSTGYKILKSKKINFEKRCERLLHYYYIPISEVERFISEKKDKETITEKQQDSIRCYYRKKMKDLPMLISAKDIRDVTGYGKEAIRNWINSEKILGTVVRKRFVVAKEDLIDFLCSPYYSNIIRKSKTHIEDLSNYILS